MDGSSNDGGLGANLILISPEGHQMHCALRFGFRTSNNEAEYEALIAGLKLAKEIKVKSLEIFSDSQLVVCQIIDTKLKEYKRLWAEELLMVLWAYRTTF